MLDGRHPSARLSPGTRSSFVCLFDYIELDMRVSASSACGLGLQPPPAARRGALSPCAAPNVRVSTSSGRAARRPRSNASTRGRARERRGRRGGRFLTRAGLGAAARGPDSNSSNEPAASWRQNYTRIVARRAACSLVRLGRGSRPNTQTSARASTIMQQTATAPNRARPCGSVDVAPTLKQQLTNESCVLRKPLHAAELEAAAAPDGGGAGARRSRCTRAA